MAQKDGKILLAGKARDSGVEDFAVARFNTDGSPDSSFDGDGRLVINMGGKIGAVSLAVQADGKILLAGTNAGHLVLARFNADGTPDSGFGTGGKLATAFGDPYDDSNFRLNLQTDGKILVAGDSGGKLALACFNSDGSADASFSGGTASAYIGRLIGDVQDAALQADGTILAVGSNGSADPYTLARFNSDGSLDSTFGRRAYVEQGTPIRLDNVRASDSELARDVYYGGASLTLARHGGARPHGFVLGVRRLCAAFQGGWGAASAGGQYRHGGQKLGRRPQAGVQCQRPRVPV